ncbi:tetratricopeptide repeat-containing sensor histidine kinase [Chitinophaga sp.]|uniref:ATP-binding protein n=1 Tax=Chitinophaga sp. TaxID=1869181 RepID=UPI0031DC1DA4
MATVGLLVRCELSFGQIQKLKNALPVTKDSVVYSRILIALAQKYQNRQLDTCFQYLTMARGVTKRIGFKWGEAEVYRGLGGYYAYRDNSYLSFRFYLDALKLYKELEDSTGMTLVDIKLGVYQHYQGRHREAEDYIKQALNMAMRLRNDSVMSAVMANYFFIYHNDTSHMALASQYLANGAQLAMKGGHTRMLIYTGLLQADELYDKGDTALAVSKVKDLVRMALKKGFLYHALYGYAQLADYSIQRHSADSMIYQKEMIRLGLEGGYREIVLPVVAKFYRYYELKHQAKEADYYADLMADITEQYEQSRSQGEQDYMDYYLQGKQLRQLQLQHDFQQQQLDRKSLEARTRYLVIICLIVLLILVILLLLDINRSHRSSRKNAARLREMNKHISEQNAQLRTHDDFKNKLISLIAHDFRSPLIQIIEITAYLQQGAFSVQEAAILFRKLESNAENTLQIFENILRWIRTQLSGFVYQPLPCTPADLIKEAMGSMKEEMLEKQVQILVQVPPDIQVSADREMLQFVHRNLLHNAIKFSPARGTIAITATTTEDTVTVCIADEGKGISTEVLDRLFEYHPGKKGTTQSKGGAGLALIICKDFMDKMGGTIVAENRSDKGSTFSYTLPCLKN